MVSTRSYVYVWIHYFIIPTNTCCKQKSTSIVVFLGNCLGMHFVSSTQFWSIFFKASQNKMYRTLPQKRSSLLCCGDVSLYYFGINIYFFLNLELKTLFQCFLIKSMKFSQCAYSILRSDFKNVFPFNFGTAYKLILVEVILEDRMTWTLAIENETNMLPGTIYSTLCYIETFESDNLRHYCFVWANRNIFG